MSEHQRFDDYSLSLKNTLHPGSVSANKESRKKSQKRKKSQGAQPLNVHTTLNPIYMAASGGVTDGPKSSSTTQVKHSLQQIYAGQQKLRKSTERVN